MYDNGVLIVGFSRPRSSGTPWRSTPRLRHNWRHDEVVERSRARVWLALCAVALGAMLGAGIALAAHGAMRPLLSGLAGIARP